MWQALHRPSGFGLWSWTRAWGVGTRTLSNLHRKIRQELKQLPQATLQHGRHPTLTGSFKKPFRVYLHPVTKVPIPSVTTVLDNTSFRKFLDVWHQRGVEEHGQETWKAMCQATLDRGHRLHAYIEHFLRGTILDEVEGDHLLVRTSSQEPDALSDAETGVEYLYIGDILEHIASVQPFLASVDPRLTLQEVTVWDNDGDVAGRFDLLMMLKNKFYIVDFKTSKRRKQPSEHGRSNAQQLAAYGECLIQSVQRLELHTLRTHGINHKELGCLLVTVYGGLEEGPRACDVVEISPQARRQFYSDYLARHHELRQRHLNLSSVDADGFSPAQRQEWQECMMSDAAAEAFDARRLASVPPTRPLRVPPKIAATHRNICKTTTKVYYAPPGETAPTALHDEDEAYLLQQIADDLLAEDERVDLDLVEAVLEENVLTGNVGSDSMSKAVHSRS
ncbi:uncharacterized protein MONBRDRAFT_25811 [Monosiga brevicollis MX1]|uniref:PD-(D/E)XK endonuclease-like domain-containing protein n=1 Tax=Monosiga brevicollis TaxID=81824 RepID=A9V0I0_MONBE|nr:uncharacterized protein MONBRDRAFT_25811 [Monosiga brevicollis MX1]EDQ89017.1 predicted protein [Monosiga brevicollis MX1]|eukprot:XP_001746122.1 hypothetical protein [Monosiga brevicollis MX1]